MIVTRLSLTDFRNYQNADVEFVPGPNLVVGDNGQGKTNLVEALGYLSTLTSHRVSSEQAMIRQGSDSAVIRTQLQHDQKSLLLEVQLNRVGPNRAQLNRGKIRMRELPRYLSTVLFAPEDLILIRGEPGERRRFLDELLILRSPRFSAVLSEYERVVRQRNSLLKSARAAGVRTQNLNTLDVWDEALVRLGTELIAARNVLISDLQPEVSAAYRAIAGSDHEVVLSSRLSISSFDSNHDGDRGIEEREVRRDFVATATISEQFRSTLLRNRRAELERGITLVGPHRDDLILELNGMPARTHASHGESWSYALSLRLGSAAVLRSESTTGDPVLILDDVFAELDEVRRARLSLAVVGFEQVLITAAVADDVPQELSGHRILIENGRVVGTEDIALPEVESNDG